MAFKCSNRTSEKYTLSICLVLLGYIKVIRLSDLGVANIEPLNSFKFFKLIPVSYLSFSKTGPYQ